MASKNPIKHTSQAIDNWSFDETYEQQAVEILVENVAGTSLVRQKPIATEAKQDDIITELNTSNVSLDNIQTYLSILKDLTKALGIAADLRVTVVSGTVGTVTTVTGITNIGGNPATGFIPATQNNIAVISNIQNVI